MDPARLIPAINPLHPFSPTSNYKIVRNGLPAQDFPAQGDAVGIQPANWTHGMRTGEWARKRANSDDEVEAKMKALSFLLVPWLSDRSVRLCTTHSFWEINPTAIQQ